MPLSSKTVLPIETRETGIFFSKKQRRLARFNAVRTTGQRPASCLSSLMSFDWRTLSFLLASRRGKFSSPCTSEFLLVTQGGGREGRTGVGEMRGAEEDRER